MLSDGIFSFWSAFDQAEVETHPRAAALLRQTRARLVLLWRVARRDKTAQ